MQRAGVLHHHRPVGAGAGAARVVACRCSAAEPAVTGGARPAAGRHRAATLAPCPALQQQQRQRHGHPHHHPHCQQQQRLVGCAASRGATDLAKFADQAYLDSAAKRFRMGLENGLDEDFLIAVELGATAMEELSATQLEYVDRIKDKLVQRAAELAAQEKERVKREAAYLAAGKTAYERGQYEDSVGFLEQAVEKAGRTSSLGGESLMWLALAYQAVGREQDCIATYKWLEDNHPLPRMRKQAADLRYIMEAPKLALSPDERVTIPLLNSEDSWAKKGRKSPYTPRYNAGAPKGPPKSKSYWDSVDWEAPRLAFLPDKWYVRVAAALILLGVTLYVNLTLGGGGGS